MLDNKAKGMAVEILGDHGRILNVIIRAMALTNYPYTYGMTTHGSHTIIRITKSQGMGNILLSNN